MAERDTVSEKSARYSESIESSSQSRKIALERCPAARL